MLNHLSLKYSNDLFKINLRDVFYGTYLNNVIYEVLYSGIFYVFFISDLRLYKDK